MINSIPHFPRYNISFFGNKTYVIGHKTPDSDSVCSAIGQAYLEPDKLADELLAQRDANLENLTPEELVKSDLKVLKTLTEKPFCVGQIKTYQSEKYLKQQEEIEEALNNLDKENHAEGSVLMITDCAQGITYLLSSDKIKTKAKKAATNLSDTFANHSLYKSGISYGEIIEGLASEKGILRLIAVQSRKEQIQPFISRLIDLP